LCQRCSTPPGASTLTDQHTPPPPTAPAHRVRAATRMNTRTALGTCLVLTAILAAPVRRETLVPAELLLASDRDADLVELPVQADPGDMAQGLRPGDRVQVQVAYTEGARRGHATILLPAAEVVRVLEDPDGLTGRDRPTGVQLRMPSASVPLVASAIATARIFLVKVPTQTATPPPTDVTEPPTDDAPPTTLTP
jgi:hypothetical protein